MFDFEAQLEADLKRATRRRRKDTISPKDYDRFMPYTNGEVSYQSQMWRLMRIALAEAQNWRCCWCYCEMDLDPSPVNKFATIEHYIPKSEGGTDDWENLVCACYECNNKRGNMPADEYDPSTCKSKSANRNKKRNLRRKRQRERNREQVQEELQLRIHIGWYNELISL